MIRPNARRLGRQAGARTGAALWASSAGANGYAPHNSGATRCAPTQPVGAIIDHKLLRRAHASA
eukprot:2159742-Pleurochrysis_carterae.AAC.1